MQIILYPIFNSCLIFGMDIGDIFIKSNCFFFFIITKHLGIA